MGPGRVPTARNLSSSSCPSSHTCSCSKTFIRWSFGTDGTSSSSSLRLSWMTTWSSMCGIEDTTRMEFESVTERMLYVLSEVHSTASSSGPPFIVRLKILHQKQSSSVDDVSANLGSSTDDSTTLHRSEGSSSKRKDPGGNCLRGNLISTSGIFSLRLALRQRHRVT